MCIRDRDRGVEGKILAARFARERKVPFFGICLGMQCCVIEFARNVCGMEGANSTEFDPQTPHPVIDLMPEQRNVRDKGGTMRLGNWPCRLKEGTISRMAYAADCVQERHRHRYEVNNEYLNRLEAKGLAAAGTSPDGKLVEIVELKGHPWYVGCQFHPEFNSTPLNAHPLFSSFIRAALEKRSGRRSGGPVGESDDAASQ